MPASVAQVRHALADVARELECDVDAVRTAVSEAVANCVIHAYRDEPGGEVVVLARPLRGQLIVTVADRGGGIAPRVDPARLGVGLPLVSRLAKDVRIESDESGTAVAMSFDCVEAPGVERAEHPSRSDRDLERELTRAREMLRVARARARRGGSRPYRSTSSRLRKRRALSRSRKYGSAVSSSVSSNTRRT